jgi:hypothetical protein
MTHNSFHLWEWAVLLVAIGDTMTVKGGNWSGRKSFQAASLVVVVARAAEYCLMSKANLWFEMQDTSQEDLQ